MTKTPVEQLFTIHQASQKCSLPKSTLRFWERRFSPFLNPIRSSGGQRRYTNTHLSIIDRIQILKKQGLGLDEVRHALTQEQIANIKPVAVVGLEHLAERVAGLVKQEVYRFFAEETDSAQFGAPGKKDANSY
jgi:DNA-binding transcriptional MerR regulator